MPTRHATRFKRTSAQMLIREYGEPIIYYPNGEKGGLVTRCINAIVNRNVEVPNEIGDQVAQGLVIRVLDDCELGISSTEINDGADAVSVPLRVGGPSTRRAIARRLDDENGMIRFLVR
jgi:hypothetical protein